MQIQFSRQLIRLVAAASCFLLAGFGTGAEAQSGLLLGLHRDSAEDGSEIPHRTLWIARQAGTWKIMELPDLIVPRKTGFWRVGTRFYCDPEEVKNNPHKQPSPQGALFAAPVDQQPTVDGVVQCPAHVQYLDTHGTCGDNVPPGASGVDVTFVNDEYLSLESWWRTDCGGHPDGGDRSSVKRLGDSEMTPVPYGDVEGEGASDEYERRAAHALINDGSGLDENGRAVPLVDGDTDYYKEIRKSFPNWSTMNEMEKVAAMETVDPACFPEHDDTEWNITRSLGGWSATGFVRTHRLCGYYVDFGLPLHESFAEPATGRINLEDIKDQITIEDVPDLKMIKGVKDLFWSPNHKLLIVLVNTDKACVGNPNEICAPRELDPQDLDRTSLLQVYSPRRQHLGKPVISMQLKEFEGPVMAEWSTGRNVARWNAELKKVNAQGVMEPLLSSSPHP